MIKQTDFYEVFGYINQWADRVFPNRTDGSIMLKMFEEFGEFVGSPNGQEAADVFILLADLCMRNDIDLLKEVHRKMVVNMNREWQINERTGIMKHVGDE